MIQLGKMINLVVCQKSKVDDWVEHFRTYYEYSEEVGYFGYTYNLTVPKSFECFMEEVECIKENELVYGAIPIYGVINYDLIWRRKELRKLKDFTLMLDESSMIQNEKAKRSKFILSMKASNVILLSGTPTSGKYENLWSQAHLLGWDISRTTYDRTYINWKTIDICGFPMKIVDKANPYKNVERLKEKLREHGAVFMKTEECFELPNQTFTQIHCKSTTEYRKFKKKCIVTVDDVELIGDTTLTKMLYQRMLCGQYNKEKLNAFKDLVESTNDRLIVFYNFKEELKRLKEIVDRPISEVNGQTRDLTAYETEDDSITFVQYQAGAKGLNLQKANKIVYFTPTLSCEDWMQSQKRIHRIGQQKPCFYYQMVCKNSIEENIYDALQRGVDFTERLFDE